MKKTTNVENPGAASVIVLQGGRKIDIACSIIIGKEDISKNPLQITDAKVHDCYCDKKGNGFRKIGNKIIEASGETIGKAHDARNDLKPVSEEELEKKGIKIDEDGEIVRKEAIER